MDDTFTQETVVVPNDMEPNVEGIQIADSNLKQAPAQIDGLNPIKSITENIKTIENVRQAGNGKEMISRLPDSKRINAETARDRISAVKCLEILIDLINWKYFGAALLPLIYIAPRSTIVVILCLAAFCLGIMFESALLGKQGTIALVLKHYEERVGRIKVEDIEVPKPTMAKISVKVNDELQESLNRLISYITRDFINRWYQRYNHSSSPEFPDAIHQSLYSVALTLGIAASKVNRADLILAVMKVVICHLKEYRKFDATGLDIEDYLKENPDSKFARLHTREQVIENLRDQAMRFAVHAMPRSERSSAIVFGMAREILATSVLLPIMEKVTAPVWLNDQLLTRLRKEPTENESENDEKDHDHQLPPLAEKNSVESFTQSPQPQVWLKYVENKLECLNQKLHDVVSEMESAGPENMQLIVEKKLKLQRHIEEMNDVVQRERELSSPQMYCPVDNASISVTFLGAQQEGFTLSKAPAKYLIAIRIRGGIAWNVEKDDSDFEALLLQLSSTLTRAIHNVPENVRNPKRLWSFNEDGLDHDKEALALEIWLSELVVDRVIGILKPVILFLQPLDKSKRLKRMSRGIWESANFTLEKSMQSALNGVGSALNQLSSKSSESLTEKMEKDEQKAQMTEDLAPSSVLTRQELEVVLDIVFSAVEELFSLTDPDQWLRQQSLSLIKVLMRTLFGKRVSRSITSKLEKASSQETVSSSINKLTDRLWPDGAEWGSIPKVIPTAYEIDHTKHQLFCMLNANDDDTKSDDFKKAVKGIRNLVGSRNTTNGLIRGFHLVQNQNLNLGLCVEILEILITVITDQKTI